MASKSQSPGPNPATSLAKQTRGRKAAGPGEKSGRMDAGSASGNVHGKESTAKKKTATDAPVKIPSTAKLAPSSQPSNNDTTSTPPTSAGPNRQRRRPRKLNRDPVPANDSTPAAASAPQAAAPSTAELEALKSRVRGLEARVEELYKAASEGRGKSPRRRGKGRRNASAQAVSSVAPPAPGDEEGKEEVEEEAGEELARAEQDLASARRDLEVYMPWSRRPRGKRTASADAEPEDIEEIPRAGESAEYVDTEGRQVTLTGSYRIPLPPSLDMRDVRTIRSGVSAAQNVARSFLEQRRAAKGAAPGMRGEGEEEGDGKSWGEWFGGYSLAISKAVRSIEAEAAVESRGAVVGGVEGMGTGTGTGTGTGRKGKRPAVRGRGSEGRG